jgi:beta-galactosidase/beta-glucuronidase
MVTVNDCLQVAVDTVNVTMGFRSVRFDANTGMYLNEQNIKVRG